MGTRFVPSTAARDLLTHNKTGETIKCWYQYDLSTKHKHHVLQADEGWGPYPKHKEYLTKDWELNPVKEEQC